VGRISRIKRMASTNERKGRVREPPGFLGDMGTSFLLFAEIIRVGIDPEGRPQNVFPRRARKIKGTSVTTRGMTGGSVFTHA